MLCANVARPVNIGPVVKPRHDLQNTSPSLHERQLICRMVLGPWGHPGLHTHSFMHMYEAVISCGWTEKKGGKITTYAASFRQRTLLRQLDRSTSYGKMRTLIDAAHVGYILSKCTKLF